MKGLHHGILMMVALWLVAAATVLTGCGGEDEEVAAAREAAAREKELAQLSEMLRPEPHFRQPYDWKPDSMPPGGIKMKINYLGGTLGKVFNDSNYLHEQASKTLGIRRVDSPAMAWHLTRQVAKIESNADYYVDNLTYSMPYLVPEAANLLTDISRAFADSLQARGGGAYRLKVTSVLRTPSSVRKLRRRNVNAIEESSHLHGTTFDISYAQFICDNASLPRTQEDLKNLLGEVLYAMQQNGRCYVKYERKQGCFHITARR